VVDSETRWRLVRALKQKPAQPEPEIEFRPVRFEDLPQVRDIYNYFIRNTVITFDDKPLDLNYWQDKQEMLEKFELPFIVMIKGPEVIGFAYVAPWRAKAGYLKIVENQIYLLPSATGKKLGGKLMKALLDACEIQGIKEVIAARFRHSDPVGNRRGGRRHQLHEAARPNRRHRPRIPP
jgi:phosphinothricin acetyltransferase